MFVEHPAFKEMIAVAARSTRGVVIPTGKASFLRRTLQICATESM